jgi:GntR family transcriptional regulator
MPDETALLALAPPAALLTVWQTAYDMANTPINITYSVQNPVTYPLRLEQGYR